MENFGKRLWCKTSEIACLIFVIYNRDSGYKIVHKLTPICTFPIFYHGIEGFSQIKLKGCPVKGRVRK